MAKKNSKTQSNKKTRLGFSSPSRLKQRRSEKVRKLGGFAAFIVLVFAVLVGLVSFGWGLRALFLSRNDHFILRSIEASSDGRLADEDIVGYLADLGVLAGESNVFALDMRELRRQLKRRYVLVKEVRFARLLPGTLQVEVFEPHPVARLRQKKDRESERCLLIARDGLVLPERTDDWASTLPLFVGFKNSADVKEGDRLEDPLLQAGLSFLSLARTDSCGQFLWPTLIQPDYAGNALKIYLASKGPFRDKAQLILPASPDKMGIALAKVDTIVRERYRARQAIGKIDATYERNIPVRP